MQDAGFLFLEELFAASSCLDNVGDIVYFACQNLFNADITVKACEDGISWSARLSEVNQVEAFPTSPKTWQARSSIRVIRASRSDAAGPSRATLPIPANSGTYRRTGPVRYFVGFSR